MGRGSEVLGYDDGMFTDHTWFARAIVFVADEFPLEWRESMQARLTTRIPDLFEGVPTEVTVTTVRQYFLDQLRLDVSVGWDAYDWVSLPEQRLCAMTAGAVFHDDLDLEKVRRRLAYYPRDVWLYLMLAGWWRVHPELNLVGRAGHAGDELGSALIASEIVTGLMRLSFLIERRYAPYAKWFGTAFSELQIADRLSGPPEQAPYARTWPQREKSLGSAYEIVAGAFSNLEIAPRLILEPVRMWGRPFTSCGRTFPMLSGRRSAINRCATWSSAGRPAASTKSETFFGRPSGGPRYATLRSSKVDRRYVAGTAARTYALPGRARRAHRSTPDARIRREDRFGTRTRGLKGAGIQSMDVRAR